MVGGSCVVPSTGIGCSGVPLTTLGLTGEIKETQGVFRPVETAAGRVAATDATDVGDGTCEARMTLNAAFGTGSLFEVAARSCFSA